MTTLTFYMLWVIPFLCRHFHFQRGRAPGLQLKLFSPQSRENKTVNTSWVYCPCRALFGRDSTQPLTPQGKKNKAKIPRKDKTTSSNP